MGVQEARVSDALLEEFSQEQLQQVDTIIENYKGKAGSLIPVLEEVQGVLGYLPNEIQCRVAQGLNLPQSQVFGVVTFYSFFTMVPRGRHTIRLCLGTACYVRGGKKNLEEFSRILKIDPGDTTPDRRFSLETVRCLGACGLAPTMIIGSNTFRQVKPTKLNQIIKDYD